MIIREMILLQSEVVSVQDKLEKAEKWKVFCNMCYVPMKYSVYKNCRFLNAELKQLYSRNF